MASTVETVSEMYAAFGRGDVPWIIDQLDDDVEWDIGVRDTGLPYLKPGRGKAHVMAFFGHVGQNLTFTRFEPGTPCVGGDTVLVPVWTEGNVIGGAGWPLSIEAHEWTFGPDGKVVSLRHIGDWASQEAAWAARAQVHAGRTFSVVGDNVEVLRGGGEFELFRVSASSEGGPPPHAHPWSESFFVLDGAVDVMVGADWQRIEVGGSATVPADCLHTYHVAPTATTASFLSTTSGARASGFFADVSASVPAGPPDATSMPALIEVAKRHGLSSPLFD